MSAFEIRHLLELLLRVLRHEVAVMLAYAHTTMVYEPFSTEERGGTHDDGREQPPVPLLDLVAVLVAEVTRGTNNSDVHDAQSREPVLGVAREVVPGALDLLQTRVDAGAQASDRVSHSAYMNTYLLRASLARSSSSSASFEINSPTLSAAALASS